MQDLRLSFIQTSLFWEERNQNLSHFERLIGQTDPDSDLILLPETFNTGFSVNPALCAEDDNGPSMAFLRRMAAQRNAVIMTTLITAADDGHYNRLVCVYPDGSVLHYDKRHLFRLSEEYRLFQPGQKRLIVDVKGWKICPLICYDLRFPVWSRNSYSDGKYAIDLTVYLANWPASRTHVWKTLLMARAIENQIFVAGVNRIGADGHGTPHQGDSMVVDFKGNPLVHAGDQEAIRSVTLPAQELSIFRESFTVGLDWDPFTLNPPE